MSNTTPRKLTVVRKPSESIRHEQGEAVHVGVDVHKPPYSVALLCDGRGLITNWVQPACPEVRLERLRPLRQGIAQVVYEGRADRLRPGPPAPCGGLPGPGHRPLEAARPGRRGGEERPPGLPPARPAL